MVNQTDARAEQYEIVTLSSSNGIQDGKMESIARNRSRTLGWSFSIRSRALAPLTIASWIMVGVAFLRLTNGSDGRVIF